MKLGHILTLLLVCPQLLLPSARLERAVTLVPAGEGSYALKAVPVGSAPSVVASSSRTFSVQFGGGRNLQPARIAVDANGNTYVAGTDLRPTPSPYGNGETPDVFLTKLDPSGQQVFTLYFGGDGSDQANGLALDPAGNVYIVGRTNSDNFPRVNAWQARRRSGRFSDAFVCKLTPDGGFIYATYLGGDDDDEALAVAADAAGNAYVTGTTWSENFPVSEGAFQTTPDLPAYGGFPPSDAFVAKIDTNGSQLVYSTRLGGKHVTCNRGSGCFTARSLDAGQAIAVDGAGNAYVGGRTNSFDFPTTPGAFQPQSDCTFFSSDGFVSKLSPDGAQLIFSTYLGGPSDVDGMLGSETVNGLAVSSSGEVYVSGVTGSQGFPTTPGSLQPNLKDPGTNIGDFVVFVTKLNPSGSALEYSTFLSGGSAVRGHESSGGIAIDSDGNAYVTGTTGSDDFPLTAGGFSRGGDFFTKLDATGAQAAFSTLLPTGFAGRHITLDADGNVELLGASSFVSRMDGQTMELPAILGVTNAAGGPVTGSVASQEIVTIYGNDIGPAEPTPLQLDEEGRVASILAGTQVLFDGVAAPLTFAQQDQINAVVPSSMGPSGSSTKLQILRNDIVVAELDLTAVYAVPGVFVNETEASPHAAALNQDGTINSRENPAPVGSVVAIFATGLGRTFPAADDGEISGDISTLGFAVAITTTNGEGFEVLYAGQAPGLVAGVAQINFRIGDVPQYASDNTLALTLRAGDLEAAFAIWSTP